MRDTPSEVVIVFEDAANMTEEQIQTFNKISKRLKGTDVSLFILDKNSVSQTEAVEQLEAEFFSSLEDLEHNLRVKKTIGEFERALLESPCEPFSRFPGDSNGKLRRSKGDKHRAQKFPRPKNQW